MFSLRIESSFQFPTVVMVTHATQLVIRRLRIGGGMNSDTLLT